MLIINAEALLSPVDNLRAAYGVLHERVIRALRTQVGDAARLEESRSQALSFIQAAAPVRSLIIHLSSVVLISQTQHHNAFPLAEYTIIQRSVTRMVEDLDAASVQSADPPSGHPPVVASRARTGKRGRPKVVIERTFLEQALALCGPTHIAPVVGCSPHTVRRRALDYQLVEPGPPVVTMTAQPDGTGAHVDFKGDASG